MPLSPPISRRVLKHTRAIQVEAFARDDGLWDIDARIIDIKTRDAKLAPGVRLAGTPIHDLSLRVTIDTRDGAGAEEQSHPPFQLVLRHTAIAGLRRVDRRRVQGAKHRRGGSPGEHLQRRNRLRATGETRRLQCDRVLDRCHALRTDGAAVAQYYPRWAVKSSIESQAS